MENKILSQDSINQAKEIWDSINQDIKSKIKSDVWNSNLAEFNDYDNFSKRCENSGFGYDFHNLNNLPSELKHKIDKLVSIYENGIITELDENESLIANKEGFKTLSGKINKIKKQEKHSLEKLKQGLEQSLISKNIISIMDEIIEKKEKHIENLQLQVQMCNQTIQILEDKKQRLDGDKYVSDIISDIDLI